MIDLIILAILTFSSSTSVIPDLAVDQFFTADIETSSNTRTFDCVNISQEDIAVVYQYISEGSSLESLCDGFTSADATTSSLTSTIPGLAVDLIEHNFESEDSIDIMLDSSEPLEKLLCDQPYDILFPQCFGR